MAAIFRAGAQKLITEFGSEAVRCWAAGCRPGTDVAFSRDVFKVGRRLATKVLNTSRFVLNFEAPPSTVEVADPVDLGLLTKLAVIVQQSTAAFESYEYTRAIERTEAFFWFFCDDYVELVKERAYRKNVSVLATLRLSLSVLLLLFAPFLPFVTEEVWSWWQQGSIHRSSWPCAQELQSYRGDVQVVDLAAAVLASVRKTKSDAFHESVD